MVLVLVGVIHRFIFLLDACDIRQGCFTGSILRLSPCKWSNLEVYANNGFVPNRRKQHESCTYLLWCTTYHFLSAYSPSALVSYYSDATMAAAQQLVDMYWFVLQWRHNWGDGVSNHQPHDCLLNRLFRRRSKKTSMLRVSGLCVGNSPVNSPHKWPVTQKIFSFGDVIV